MSSTEHLPEPDLREERAEKFAAELGKSWTVTNPRKLVWDVNSDTYYRPAEPHEQTVACSAIYRTATAQILKNLLETMPEVARVDTEFTDQHSSNTGTHLQRRADVKNLHAFTRITIHATDPEALLHALEAKRGEFGTVREYLKSITDNTAPARTFLQKQLGGTWFETHHCEGHVHAHDAQKSGDADEMSFDFTSSRLPKKYLDVMGKFLKEQGFDVEVRNSSHGGTLGIKAEDVAQMEQHLDILRQKLDGGMHDTIQARVGAENNVPLPIASRRGVAS